MSSAEECFCAQVDNVQSSQQILVYLHRGLTKISSCIARHNEYIFSYIEMDNTNLNITCCDKSLEESDIIFTEYKIGSWKVVDTVLVKGSNSLGS